MKVHVYDFRWLDEKTAEFQASAEKKFGRKAVKIGDTLSLENCSNVRCAGSMSREGVWTPCPENASGRAKCDLCKMRERNFVFTAFDGFDRTNISESDLELISGPHVVYLALFDTNIVKVGVTNATRKVLRQLEQGSHGTLFIAETPDGIYARQIETILRKNGIADKVKISQKREFLRPEISKSEGEALLRKTFEDHKKSLSEYEQLKKFLLKRPEFSAWDQWYGLDTIKGSGKGFHDIDLKVGEWVSGTIKVMKGPFLVLETDDEFAALSMKELLGREIDFAPRPAGVHLHEALQGTFF